MNGAINWNAFLKLIKLTNLMLFALFFTACEQSPLLQNKIPQKLADTAKDASIKLIIQRGKLVAISLFSLNQAAHK